MAYELARKVTNLFLYGSETTPTNLVDDELIRGNVTPPPLVISTAAFMTTGGGRFAVGRQFEIVNRFFTETLAPGTYSKNDLRDKFGLEKIFWSMQQYDFRDGKDDYAERVYVFNSMNFQITDDARFIVEGNGERRIENFSIAPHLTIAENFDFESSDWLTMLGNQLYLKTRIDPSGIGHTVKVNFLGSAESLTYTGISYFNDLLLMNSWDGGEGLFSEIDKLQKDLWDSGVTRFLDSHQRPILYGTAEDNTLAVSSIDDPVLFPTLKPYQTNGAVVLSGDGNDVIYAGAFDDVLYGGDGSDTLYADLGTDTLHGEAGNDSLYDKGGLEACIFYGGSGADKFFHAGGIPAYIDGMFVGFAATIMDAESTDRLYWANSNGTFDLIAGLAVYETRNLSPGWYLGTGNQTTYMWYDKGNLSMSSVTVRNFQPGMLGIYLGPGTAGNDHLSAKAEYEQLLGFNGNDTLEGGVGYNSLDGGEGRDSARYDRNRSDYQLRVEYENQLGVTSTALDEGRTITVIANSGDEGTDRLIEIERVVFKDRSVAFDFDGAAGITAKTLGAVFGAAAVHNETYAGIGIGLIDQGWSYEQLMSLAITKALGAQPKHEEVVDLLYFNVAGVPPPAATKTFYVSLLDSGTYSTAALGVLAADSSFNAAKINLTGLLQHGLEYYPLA